MNDGLNRILDFRFWMWELIKNDKSGVRIPRSEIEGACSSAWLERTPDKREVDGSTPSRPTKGDLGFRILDLETTIIPQSAIPDPQYFLGGVAQLGERLPCTQEAIGSNPFTSTRIKSAGGEAIRSDRASRFSSGKALVRVLISLPSSTYLLNYQPGEGIKSYR
jgi:hypothetical protein